MDHLESERSFALYFRQVFGVMPNVFMYEFQELKARLESAEMLLQQLTSGSLSMAMKLEATTMLLATKRMVGQEELYHQMGTYKENLKIEG